MRTNKLFLLLGGLALLATSCSRDKGLSNSVENPVRKIATALELKTFIDQPVDGYLCIKSQNGYSKKADIQWSGSYRMGGHIYIDKNGVPKDAGTVEIDGVNLSAESTRDYMYGLWDHDQAQNSMAKTVNFKLKDEADVERFSEDMYVPDDVYFDCFDENVITVDDGFELTWNADPSNTLGVGIIVRHMTVDEHDQTITVGVNNARLSDDDGSYTLAVEDFSGISSGSLVKITLVRGNYKTVTDLVDPSRQYGLFAHLSASAILKYEDL